MFNKLVAVSFVLLEDDVRSLWGALEAIVANHRSRLTIPAVVTSRALLGANYCHLGNSASDSEDVLKVLVDSSRSHIVQVY